MKYKIFRSAVLWILVLALSFSVCSCTLFEVTPQTGNTTTSKNDKTDTKQTEPEEQVFDVVIVDYDKTSAFTLVYADTETQALLDVKNAVKTKYGIDMTPFRASARADAENQILIGKTDRQLSLDLAEAVDAKAAECGGLSWGIAYRDGRLALYATNAVVDGVSSWNKLVEDLKTNYFKLTFSVKSNLFSVKNVPGTTTPTDPTPTDPTPTDPDEEAAKKAAEAAAAAERGKVIASLQSRIASYRTADYGTVKSFKTYSGTAATVTPAANTHPRVAVNSSRVSELLTVVGGTSANPVYAYQTGEDLSAYTRLHNEFVNDADYLNPDYFLLPAKGTSSSNYDSNRLLAIEGFALHYLLEHKAGAVNDEATVYGYRAVSGMLDYLRTVDLASSGSTFYRNSGYIIYIAAEVYDWCYDLMTDKDRENMVKRITSYVGLQMEINYSSSDPTPSKQGAVVGHGSEAQLLRDWLAFAIAVYDEYPAYYNYVAARIQNEYVPVRNYMYAGDNVWQGNGYGIYRAYFDFFSEYLFQTMQCKANPTRLYSFDVADVAEGLAYNMRPDGTLLRIGDDLNERGKKTTDAYKVADYGKTMFMAYVLSGSGVAKSEAYTYLNSFTGYYWDDNSLTYSQFLLWNDTTVAKTSVSTLPKAKYYSEPSATLIARTSWSSQQGALLYMKMSTRFSANHEHADIGSFQIYYKGMLAIDSGFYDAYSSTVESYNRSTAAHNTLLIGGSGQSLSTTEPTSVSGMATSATVLGTKILYDAKGNPTYAYLAGDMTKSYSSRANEVVRYMVGIFNYDANGNATNTPLVFMVLDEVKTSTSKKTTFLLHMLEEPTVSGNTVVIKKLNSMKNGSKATIAGGGVLVDQAFTPTGTPTVEKKAGAYGGITGYTVQGSYNDSLDIVDKGWGHVEISNTATATVMLNVMYVTDSSTYSSAGTLAVSKYSGTNILGASIPSLGVANFFNTTKTSLTSATVQGTGSGTLRYSVCGMADGVYTVKQSGATVATATASGGLLTFTAPAGTYAISK